MEWFRERGIYYGWWITLALAITETVSYGVLYYAFSVYVLPINAEMGWSVAQIYGAQSLALFVSAFVFLPVGVWLDYYGARWLMSGGSIIATVLVVAWSQVQSLPAFYLVWFGIGITMASLFYEPAFTVIAKWFVRLRGRALTLITLVAGFASTIFLPLADALLETYGWRGAVLVLAIILGAVTIPLHLIVLRNKPSDLGLLPDGQQTTPAEATTKPKRSASWREALGNMPFWWLTLAFALMGISSLSIRTHFVPLLIDGGYDNTFAAWIAGLIGFMQVVGRLIFAPMETRFAPRTITIAIFGLQIFSVLTLQFAQTDATMLFFVALYGSSIGALTLARPLLLADLYGSAQYGRISSVMAFCTGIVATGAPIGAGLLYDIFGSYDPVIWIMLGIAIISIVPLFLINNDMGNEPAIGDMA